MATAPLLVRRAAAALAAACALLVLVPAVASAVPPTNDSATTPLDISTTNLLGIRVPARDAQTGGLIFGVDMADATPAPDDPVLKNDNDQSNCNPIPTQGSDTVFFRLTGINERTAITIDTLGSTYQTGIAIFEGSIAQGSIIRCERGNLAGGTSSVDFVSEMGKTYFVEVASVTGSGLLNLYIRAHDIQPPTIAISAPSVLAEPNGLTMFQLAGGNVTESDDGSGVNTSRAYEWSATFQPDQVENGPETTSFPIAVTPAPGNESATVQWPERTNWQAGNGTAMVRVWDNAGNMGTARITLKVRDRQDPKVLKPSVVKSDRRKRVTLRAACSEPGTLRMEFRNQTRRSRFVRKIEIPIRRANVVRSATWKRVRADVYLAQWTCTDGSGNDTVRYDTFLFGF